MSSFKANGRRGALHTLAPRDHSHLGHLGMAGLSMPKAPWYPSTKRGPGQVQQAGLGQIATWSPPRDLRACRLEVRMGVNKVRYRGL